MMLSSQNAWIEAVLHDFLDVVPRGYRYVVLGSVALISYTAKNGYRRKVKDIDIIGDACGFEHIASSLVRKGYAQGTFIEKRYPFSAQLLRLARTKYCRFVKEGKSLEVMTTDFGDTAGKLSVELYPGIAFSIPSEAIQPARLDSLSFQAATPELLLMVYRFGSRTWGRVVKKNQGRREEDMKHLSKVVDQDTLQAYAGNVSIRLGRFSLRVPALLVS